MGLSLILLDCVAACLFRPFSGSEVQSSLKGARNPVESLNPGKKARKIAAIRQEWADGLAQAA
jgi:hypothetical protein